MLVVAALALISGSPVDPHSRVELVASQVAVRAGASFDVALRFRMDPGWHVYWKNPGESGMAPSVVWRLPKGWKAGPIEWPVPERIDNGGVVNYAYEKEVFLISHITTSRDAQMGTEATIQGDVSWLCCRESCIPGKAKVSQKVHIGRNEIANAQWFQTFAKTRQALPVAAEGVQLSAQLSGKQIQLSIRTRQPLGSAEGTSFFCSDDAVEPSAEQSVRPAGDGITMTLKVSPFVSHPPVRLRGLLLAPKGREWSSGTNAVPVDIPLTRSTK